jgi:uncharacterized membrane protein
MKKYFITGLALLLPMVLTFLIVAFAINVLTTPFVGSVASILKYYGIMDRPFLFLSAEKMVLLSSKAVVLVGLVVVTLTIGMIGQWVIMKTFGQIGDFILHRIPIVNTIYKSTQDIVTTLLSDKEQENFSSVVLVPFPYANTRSIGFVTKESMPEGSDAIEPNHVSVFVPGTPNPAMGFMLIFKRDHLQYLDMRVDDALKLVISCGVIWPDSFLSIPQDISAK